MRKRILLIIVVCLMVLIGGCQKDEEKPKKEVNLSAKAFKEEYESLNGLENKKGVAHRVVSIDENNPYEKVTAEEILQKIENNETFYVYFGDKLCPWCRSVIEKSIEVANKENIEKIYYIAIWDDEGNEILRDKYEYVNGKLTKTIEGTETYYKLLEHFDSVLTDYKVTNDKGKKKSTGEKRIYAPNYIYVENGQVVSLIEGISSLQKDSREELTEEMLKEEEKIFTEFFRN